MLDRSGDVGSSWAGRYDSLRLNTVRWMSDLPGHRMPQRMGRWVGRDDLVAYLSDYARWHGLEVRTGVDVDRLAMLPNGRWRAESGGHDALSGVDTDAVVVATGAGLHPVVPEWPDSGFVGQVWHSSSYQSPERLLDRRVVVVGAGSSGGEVVVDLARAGCDVTWAVRGAPRVFPREVMGAPATPVAALADLLPPSVVDAGAPSAERFVYGERDYLPAPAESMMELLAHCKEPLTADGIVDLIRSGSVRVVGAVRSLSPAGVELEDSSAVAADVVIAATGYRPGLEPLVGHLGVLGPSGRPIASVPRRGLGFVGFRTPLTGTLWAIERDARRVAAALARHLTRCDGRDSRR